jgi:ABC-type polysaccharide/polyol phosphate transport system ATPase subunit
VGGRPPVDVCLFRDSTDDVVPWLFDHDWIDEPVLRVFLDHVGPGMRVLDLGAQLGLFALSAASLGASVVAVDDVPGHIEQLRLAAARNGFTDLRAVLGVAAATADQHVHDRGQAAPTVAVADVLADAGWAFVDVVKMDIEGMELDALRGMSRLFRRGRQPVVVFESNGGMLPEYSATPRQLGAWLTRRGYSLWLIDYLRPGRLVAGGDITVQSEAVVDFLALPAGRTPPDHWRVDPAPSRDETVTRLLDQARDDHPWFRRYVADTLAAGPAWLRHDPLVEPSRVALAEDVSADVRAHAPPRSARPRWSRTQDETDPTLAVLARDAAVAERPEVLARAPGQRLGTGVSLLFDGLSFHIRRGSFVGVIGAHAHELSEFLATVAGRRPVVRGALDVHGRVLLLNQLALGFDPELSARENVTVLAAFLGHDVPAAAARAGEFADRAGLGARIDDPLGDQPADSIARLASSLVLDRPSADLLLIGGLPRVRDGSFAEWARDRTYALRAAGATIVQTAPDPAALLGPPDRLLYLANGAIRAAGHPASVDDLFRRHALGLDDRELRLLR